jgi:hypothetical protein
MMTVVDERAKLVSEGVRVISGPNSFGYLEKEECTELFMPMPPNIRSFQQAYYKERHGFCRRSRAQAAEV